MAGGTVTVVLQTADKTRKAQITVPRSMSVQEVIKATTKRWILSSNVDYQIYNVTANISLLANDMMTIDRVNSGDVLMLQPFPTHGRG